MTPGSRAVVATPGLTAIADLDEARRALLDDSLRGVDLVSRFAGPIVDVGSGGGAPGIPLAHALPEREVVLLEAERRKCEFLERVAPPNARVVWGRAEEQETRLGGRRRREGAGASADRGRVVPAARAARRRGRALGRAVGGAGRGSRRSPGDRRRAGDAPDGFLVIRKTGPTPDGFPRRVGVAKKRPLA